MSEGKRLPRVQWKTNIPQRLIFPYGNARFMKSRTPGWKDSYLFTVENEDGDTQALFATPYLHDLLVQAGLGKGGIVDITRAEGDVSAETGRPRVEWQVDVLDPGTPVEHAKPPSEAQDDAGGAPAPSRGPGSRPDAEGRLGELGAAYAACVDEAKAIWQRSTAGISGKLDYETTHSTASSLFITLQREGYDLAAFAAKWGETAGMQALRKLAERVQTEPYLADVQAFYGERLVQLPSGESDRRALFVELREAVKAATQAAAANTEPNGSIDEDFPEDVDFSAPAAKPARQSAGGTPAHVKEAQEAIVNAYGSELSEEQTKQLNMFLAKITRTDFTPVEELTEAQAKVLIRTLANIKARGA